MNGGDQTLQKAMQSTAAVMMSSPRQAPGGAAGKTRRERGDNAQKGRHIRFCRAASLVAKPSRLVAARSVPPPRNLAAALELSGDWARRSEPRHGHSTGNHARSVAASAKRASGCAPDTPINLADALVGPDVLRPHLVNWAEVAGYFIRTVEADAAADGSVETAELLERLLSYEAARPLLKAGTATPPAGPVLAMHFCKGDTSLRLFTTMATLGTPQDVMLQEILIESFFPMDAGTATALRGRAAR
jgi:hypothetical protein